MNVMVQVRTNGLGTLTPSRTAREAVNKELNATTMVRMEALLRKSGMAGVAKATAGQSGEDALTNDALDKDAFLSLLLEQIRNQDPLEPMDNTDMIAQLAQFSALEQQTNLNTNFENMAEQFAILSGNIDQLNFISAQGLIDRYVTGISAKGEAVEGYVEAVGLDGSIVILKIGDKFVPMSGVLGVGSSPEDTPGATGGDDASDSKQQPAL